MDSILCRAVLTETVSLASPLCGSSVVYNMEAVQKLRETRNDGFYPGALSHLSNNGRATSLPFLGTENKAFS